MSFAPGQFITAQRLNRLQDASYVAECSGTVAASQTNADIPGMTETFTVEADGAEAICSWSVDFDLSGATTSPGTSRLLLDSVTAGTRILVYAAEVSTDRSLVTSFLSFTGLTAGVHTIKAQATTPANMTVNTQGTLHIRVKEVV